MQLHGIQVRPSRKGHPTPHRPHHAKMKFFGQHDTPKATSPDEKHAELDEQTQKWVSQTFFGQMLKQMRDSPFKSKLFSGGHGGEAFQQMADQRTADSMARGTGHKLVDAIVAKIEHPDLHGPATAQVTESSAAAARAGAKLSAQAAAATAKVNASKVTASAAGRDWGHA